MARKPREDVAGAIHHVYARGVRKQAIYRDRVDHVSYLFMLGDIVQTFEWNLFAYCLMGNHVHLVVETPRPTLARGMCLLHGDYARLFNERHGESGHVFERRYGSKRARTDQQLWMAVRYVDDNPVKASLCKRPEEWRWGSRYVIARGEAPEWLAHEQWGERVEAMFGPTPGTGAADR